VPSLELHVDLRKAVPVSVAQFDQAVVAADQPKDDQDCEYADHQQNNANSTKDSCNHGSLGEILTMSSPRTITKDTSVCTALAS
jgi:hypothetical protein